MILRERYIRQPINGDSSWNSNSDFSGVLQQLIVNPSAAATTYDFSMTNDLGDVVYDKKGLKGTFIDDSKLGLFGIYTMDIANASDSTKSFSISLIWREIV